MGQFKRAFVFIIAMVVSLVVVATPSFADESSRVLVENSWRFHDGQLITPEDDSEDAGISAYSLSRLPDGVTAQGIDVSEHQGNINWDAVKASGVDFAILRVGFGAPSFGGRTDYQFQRNISECERLGIPYGIYLYSYAWDDGQAADEAAFVISSIAGHSPQLPIYYDLEDNSIIADGRQGGVASRASVFCNRIINAGYKVGIYANLNWFNNVLTDPVFNSPSWDHWIAQYNYQCDYAGKYSFWQYASDGSVDGISGSVDMNYAYITIESNEDKWDRADELAAAHSSDLPDGTYTVASLVSGSTVFDAGMGGRSNGCPLQAYGSNGTDAQAWQVTHDGDYVVLRCARSGLAVDCPSSSTANGTPLQLYSYNGTRAQKWIAVKGADGSYSLLSANDPSVCIDLPGSRTNDGNRLQLYAGNGTAAQSWSFSAYRSPQSRADELAAAHSSDLPDGTYTVASLVSGSTVFDAGMGGRSNGCPLQAYGSNGTDAQAWQVTHDGDYVVLRCARSGLAVDCPSSSTANGTPLQLYSYNGTRAQKWIAVKGADGSYSLLSANDPSVCIDLPGSRTNDGNRLQLYAGNGTAAQSWSFKSKH